MQTKNIKHKINFSGRKFHLYIGLKNHEQCQHVKDALYNMQVEFCNQVGFTFGKEDHSSKINPDIDSKLMGNLAGLTRIDNTFNPSGQRFCISLNSEMLYSGFENIVELAKHQHFLKDVWFGQELIDLTQFDKERFSKFSQIESINIPMIDVDEDFGEEKLYPCVKKMLVERSGYNGWFQSALWLREKGFTYQEADAIFKKYLSKYKRTDGWGNDYLHAIHSDKTLETVYKDTNQKYLFPNCFTIFKEGNCPGKCSHFQDMYVSRRQKEIVNLKF